MYAFLIHVYKWCLMGDTETKHRNVSSFVCLWDVLGFVVCPLAGLMWLHCVTDVALGFFCWRHVKLAWPQTDVEQSVWLPHWVEQCFLV